MQTKKATPKDPAGQGLRAITSRSNQRGDGDAIGGRIEKPERLTDLAYGRLREAIGDFSLKPGESIGEPDLSSRLGISRNSTREALIRLEAGGFVSRQAGGRWFVYAMSSADAEEVYECRAALEGLAAQRAARLAAEGVFDPMPLHIALEAARQAFREGDPEAVAKHSDEFHVGLVQAAGNRKLTTLLDALQPQFRYNRLMMMRHGVREGFLDENAALLRAVLAGDAPGAQEIVKKIAAADLRAVVEMQNSGQL
jgi:DNA-binding GntR family transcriptional regulator